MQEGLEWAGLNVASWVMVALPSVPSIEHAVEFVLKVVIGISVVALNIYKIREVRSKKKPPTSDQ